MAKISGTCPNCSAPYRVDAALRGKKGRCARCRTEFLLADTGQPPAGRRFPTEDAVPAALQKGDVLLDLYEVREVFSGGGMGLVYRVHHRGWNRDLAVKSPRPELLARAGAAADLEREAETWVKLGLHPHTVTCFYVRRLGGTPRVFAEYIEGGSLADWVRSRKLYEGGPEQSLERILDIAIQFAWGLHYAHERGLVHQDVKPANVLMTGDEIAKVTDFGLAKARVVAGETAADHEGETILVSVGGMTPAYCSPEQAAGKPLSRKTDVYSWAVSVLEMFTGEVTWPAGQVAGAALDSYLEGGERNPGLPAMPPGLAALLRQCLQPRPEARPAGMQEVAAALRDLYQQLTGQAHGRDLPEPGELLADSLNLQAVSLFDLGKREEAEQKWQEALRVDPHHPEAIYNGGLIQWRSARMTDEQLLRQLREARTSCVDPARVDYLLGLVYLERDDCAATVQILGQTAGSTTGAAEVTAALTLARARAEESSRHVRCFQGHTDAVESVAWSRDGRLALSGSWDTTLRLWEPSSGRCLRTFEGHTDWVRSVAWSPDGRFALSGGKDRMLRLWEVSSGRCLRTFEGHTKGVRSVAWNPDGGFALSGSDDATLRLWQVASGRCLRTFEGHREVVTSVACSPEGSYALSASWDATLRLWEVANGRCLRTFEGHALPVSSVAWSPDGRLALSASGDNPAAQRSDDYPLLLWDVSDGRYVRAFTGHTEPVKTVAWSADGRFAISGGDDGILRLWEISSGRCLRTFEGYTYHVTSVAWSPDGRFALSGAWDKTVRLWWFPSTRLSSPLAMSQPTLVDQAPYRRLVSQACQALQKGESERAAALFEKARQEPGCTRRPEVRALARQLSRHLGHAAFFGGWLTRPFIGHSSPVAEVAWSPNGRFVLSGSCAFEAALRLWEVPSGRSVRVFEGHKLWVNSLAWSPDGRFVLSGGYDNTPRLWDVSSGRCLRAFEGHTKQVLAVAWSADGRFALSGGEDEMVRLWDVSSGRCVGMLKGSTHAGWRGLSPDGRFALLRGEGSTLGLWEVSSGRCIRTFERNKEKADSGRWSPDGRFVLSHDGSTVWLWEVSSGRCLRTFEGHTLLVTSVAWSPDGRFALSGGIDKTVRLWEVSSGRCLRTFEGHTKGVTAVAWNPDGHFALSGSEDYTLRLWELDWELERNQPADWNDRARPYLEQFLTLHSLTKPGLLQSLFSRQKVHAFHYSKPKWTEDDFQRLLYTLGCAGYGWLRPEGVRRELEKLAATWQGPPPL